MSTSASKIILALGLAIAAITGCGAAPEDESDQPGAMSAETEEAGLSVLPPDWERCKEVVKPQPGKICTTIYLPVCGCDGVTYPNACVAAREGVAILKVGRCDPKTPPRWPPVF